MSARRLAAVHHRILNLPPAAPHRPPSPPSAAKFGLGPGAAAAKAAAAAAAAAAASPAADTSVDVLGAVKVCTLIEKCYSQPVLFSKRNTLMQILAEEVDVLRDELDNALAR